MHLIETTHSRGDETRQPRPATATRLPRQANRHRSRAALNLKGLCPVCGGDATRRLTATASESHETYNCPIDGETIYTLDQDGRRIRISPQDPTAPTHTRDPAVPIGWFRPLQAAV